MGLFGEEIRSKTATELLDEGIAEARMKHAAMQAGMKLEQRNRLFGPLQQQQHLTSWYDGLFGGSVRPGVPPIPKSAAKTVHFGKDGVEAREPDEPIEVIRLYHDDMRWIHRYI